MTNRSQHLAAAALILCSGWLLYGGVLTALVDAWANDGNYSHGFLIPPLAAYLAWERRRQIEAAAIRPSAAGLVLVAGGVALLVVGTLGAELFLTRISFVATLTGAILFLYGGGVLRTLIFPLSILLLMIPLPAMIFNQIAFPLQLLASRFGEFVIASAGVPVLREGNVLTLANTSLEVAEACSGIRSLISLLTLGIVFGHFTDPRPTIRTAIALSTVPIAILANGMRVAGTGIGAHYFGPEVAQGFFHEFSGWLLFVVAFALLVLVQRLIVGLLPNRNAVAAAPAAPAAAA